MAHISYKIDFGTNTLTGHGARVRRKFEKISDIKCHHFALSDQLQEATSAIEIVAGKTVAVWACYIFGQLICHFPV